jgi:hypothetical protein
MASLNTTPLNRKPEAGPRRSAWLEKRSDGLYSLRCCCAKGDRQPLHIAVPVRAPLHVDRRAA